MKIGFTTISEAFLFIPKQIFFSESVILLKISSFLKRKK